MNNSELDLTDSCCSIKNDQEADYIINVLKSQLQHYTSKNAQYTQILAKLKITPETLSLTSRETLNTFTKLQDAAKVNKLDMLDVEMSYLDNATCKYKLESEIAQLKLQFENLSELNDKMITDISTTDKEIIDAKYQIDNLLLTSPNELQKLILNVKSYEENIKQYIEKYPWLNEPEYNLLHVQDEIKKLYRLKEESGKLKMDSDAYEGLKPDLFSAKNQLANLKLEYNKICKLIADRESVKS